MGEKYIKREDGKEVVYEKGIFGDRKVGQLHDNLDGSKSTRNIFGENIRVNPEGLTGERKAKEDGQRGVFRKDFLDSYPTFKPEKDR
jgi:hypothetical protein